MDPGIIGRKLKTGYHILSSSSAKNTFGEVGTKMVIWWLVVSGIFVPKIIRIRIVLQVTTDYVGVSFSRHSVQAGYINVTEGRTNRQTNKLQW